MYHKQPVGMCSPPEGGNVPEALQLKPLTLTVIYLHVYARKLSACPGKAY